MSHAIASHDTALHRIGVKFRTMPLRTLFFILLFANLLLFSGGYMGWLGDSGARGEPERLSNQLHPEYIQPGPAPRLPAEKTSSNKLECVAYTLAHEQGSEAERIAGELHAEITSVRHPSQNGGSWRVQIPPANSTEAATRRARELSEQGITDLFVIRNNNVTHNTISLGLFSSEKHALQRLDDLHSRGVTDAELIAPPIAPVRIEFRGPQPRIEALIQRFDISFPNTAHRSCTP